MQIYGIEEMKENNIPIINSEYKKITNPDQEIAFLKKISSQIESSIWVANKESINQNYRDKYRTLYCNLKNPENQELRIAIINNTIVPSNLANMNSKDLISTNLQKKRIEREAQYLKENVLIEAPSGTVVAYSHKV